MKLKAWLREHKNMTYAQLKEMDEFDRDDLLREHREFCRKEQIYKGLNWRPATEQEKQVMDAALEKDRKLYEANAKIGAVNEYGNYIPLWWIL